MTDTIHYHRCTLCGSSETAPFTEATDHLVSGRQFMIFRCKDCGFLFTQDTPTPASIGQYYESDDYQPHRSQSGLMPFVYRSVRYLMFRWKLSLIKHYHTSSGTILDVGAGSGHFLAYMHRKGWKTMGCEQSHFAREFARERYHLLLDGEVMKCDYSSKHFDVITAWHAIEHIHDLHGLWKCFGRWSKTDGLLVIAVPNCDSLDARQYGNHWAAWDVPRHLWHFNANTMVKLGHQHGFRLINIHSMQLDACYISLLSDSNKLRGFVNGLRLALLETIHRQQSSSLVFLFRKAN